MPLFFSMDKHVFDFINPGFSAATSAHCSLHAVVGTDAVSLLVTGKNYIVQALKHRHFSSPGRDFKDMETQVRMAFGSEMLFSNPFAQVRFIFFNLNATLVPRRLFMSDDLPAYFNLLLRPADYEFHYDHLPEFDCYLVYAVEPVMTRICGQYFPQAKLSHLATGLLQNWHSIALRDGYEIFLNVRNQAAQVAVIDRQNLLFYNAFQFQKNSDLLYFVLLAYEQFRLDPAEIPLTVSGNLIEDSDAYRLLYRYVQTIRFATLPEYAHLPEDAGSLPAHFWLDTFSFSKSPVSTP
jgi:hypothetical protein